jgi:hypothetical protein
MNVHRESEANSNPKFERRDGDQKKEDSMDHTEAVKEVLPHIYSTNILALIPTPLPSRFG